MDALLTDLCSRLPELEWKIGNLSSFSKEVLPPGLFRFGLTAAQCVNEIKLDIQALSQQNHPSRAFYIAQGIQRKINVLVSACQILSKKDNSEKTTDLALDRLKTRQQWIGTLEQDIHTLTLQRQALSKALEQMQMNTSANVAGTLCLQRELGEINKRLTLAEEQLNQAIS